MTAIQLTPRDKKIILMIYSYDGLVSYQIRRRYWPSFGSRSAFFDRLSRLVAAGFLRRKRLESPTGKGSGPSLITLGRQAHPILIEQLGLTSTDIRRLRHSFVPLLWLHEAEVRDFRLALDLACQAARPLSLTEWQNECDLRRSPIKVKVATTPIDLVPDGIFTLTVGERSKRYYLEIDRGTEMAPQRWKSRVKAYLHHIGQEPTPVLIVVPTQKRADQLSRWIQDAASEVGGSPGIFAIGLREKLRENTIVQEPVWQVVGQSSFSSLIPAQTVAVPRPSPRPQSWSELVLGEEFTRA
jgi:hypothetical protein